MSGHQDPTIGLRVYQRLTHNFVKDEVWWLKQVWPVWGSSHKAVGMMDIFHLIPTTSLQSQTIVFPEGSKERVDKRY